MRERDNITRLPRFSLADLQDVERIAEARRIGSYWGEVRRELGRDYDRLTIMSGGFYPLPCWRIERRTGLPDSLWFNDYRTWGIVAFGSLCDLLEHFGSV